MPHQRPCTQAFIYMWFDLYSLPTLSAFFDFLWSSLQRPAQRCWEGALELLRQSLFPFLYKLSFSSLFYPFALYSDPSLLPPLFSTSSTRPPCLSNPSPSPQKPQEIKVLGQVAARVFLQAPCKLKVSPFFLISDICVSFYLLMYYGFYFQDILFMYIFVFRELKLCLVIFKAV